MTNLKKIILFCSLTMFTTTAFSLSGTFSDSFFQADPVEKEDVLVLTITINGSSVIKLKNIPTIGHFEVMSILGKRVTIVNLKDCANGVYIDLPNGIYVLKAGKVSQKIVVRN